VKRGRSLHDSLIELSRELPQMALRELPEERITVVERRIWTGSHPSHNSVSDPAHRIVGGWPTQAPFWLEWEFWRCILPSLRIALGSARGPVTLAVFKTVDRYL